MLRAVLRLQFSETPDALGRVVRSLDRCRNVECGPVDFKHSYAPQTGDDVFSVETSVTADAKRDMEKLTRLLESELQRHNDFDFEIVEQAS